MVDAIHAIRNQHEEDDPLGERGQRACQSLLALADWNDQTADAALSDDGLAPVLVPREGQVITDD